MTFAQVTIAAIVLTVAAIGALFVISWKLAFHDGWESCLDDQRSRKYLEAIRERREEPGRRRRPVPVMTGREYFAAVPPPPRRRVVTTAAGDRVPVTVVPVGPASVPMRPQPGRDSGPGTVTMPALTDTGEIRAVSAAYIAQVEQQEEAWRAQRAAAWQKETAR